MKRIVFYIFSALLLIMCAETASGQKFPERRLIRDGNRDYGNGNYVDSEVDYRRALENTPYSYEGHYNLGNALYKQERYDEAAQIYLRLDSLGKNDPAGAHYNAGNALLKQRKLDEAIEEYKKSLRVNPDDRQTKFNLAYAKKLRDENKKDDQDNQDNKDNKDNQDNKDNKDNPDKDNKDQQKQNPDQQQKKSGMSKEEAQQMLEAMQMNEDKTREKIDEKKAAVVEKSDKNW